MFVFVLIKNQKNARLLNRPNKLYSFQKSSHFEGSIVKKLIIVGLILLNISISAMENEKAGSVSRRVQQEIIKRFTGELANRLASRLLYEKFGEKISALLMENYETLIRDYDKKNLMTQNMLFDQIYDQLDPDKYTSTALANEMFNNGVLEQQFARVVPGWGRLNETDRTNILATAYQSLRDKRFDFPRRVFEGITMVEIQMIKKYREAYPRKKKKHKKRVQKTST